MKGIGEKGAQKLLAEFGDLETMLARAGEVSAKRPREALLSQAENARLSRELVTIKRDVPVELDVGDLVLHEPDRDAVIRLLTELEFYTLVRRLTDATAPQEAGIGDTAEAENGKAGELDFSADSWLSLSDLSGPSAPPSASWTIPTICLGWSSVCGARRSWESMLKPAAASPTMRRSWAFPWRRARRRSGISRLAIGRRGRARCPGLRSGTFHR